MTLIPPIKIIPMPTLKDNYVWVMVSPETASTLIVDPGEAEPVIAYLQKNHLRLSGILITHHHADHTQGILQLIAMTKVSVFGPARQKIQGVTHPVQEPETVSFPQFPTFQVFDIPGHTLSHIAFYTPGSLFPGDTLFAAGCGRLFEGSALQMYDSLQKLASLPNETKIYCAHEYTLTNLRFAKKIEPNNAKIDERLRHVMRLREENKVTLPTTIKDEKETNPFLRCENEELIKALDARSQKIFNSPVERFAYLRHLKDDFS